MSKKIGIWGLGLVGKSAIRYFFQKGYTLEAIDRREPTAQEWNFLNEYQVTFSLQDQLIPFLERMDHILASCGIDVRPYDQYCHKWLSELDIFAAECTKPIIAITGSVGKTTVTHLLSQLLASHDKKVFTGGNIGVGLLDSIEQANDADYVVLEVSSFQLERCTTFAPAIAVCTNLHANHLDRHGSLENYINAKLSMVFNQKESQVAVLPLSLLHAISPELKSRRKLIYFSDKKPTSQDLKKITDFHKIYFLHNSTLFMNYQTNTLKIFDFIKLPEISYRENVTILATILTLLELPLTNFVEILDSQELPQHRLEKVATINGADFYNDSKSTIPASTLAAIEKIQGKPILLFLGGVSKGVDRSDLVRQLQGKVRHVYCFGKEAEQLKTFCDRFNVPAFACSTLDEVFALLPSHIQKEDQILFSPAGASFDLFKDYQERGVYFKKLTMELAQKISHL